MRISAPQARFLLPSQFPQRSRAVRPAHRCGRACSAHAHIEAHARRPRPVWPRRNRHTGEAPPLPRTQGEAAQPLHILHLTQFSPSSRRHSPIPMHLSLIHTSPSPSSTLSTSPSSPSHSKNTSSHPSSSSSSHSHLPPHHPPPSRHPLQHQHLPRISSPPSLLH